SSVGSAIFVGAPEGASAIPPGFANVGLAGAGGAAGISTGVLRGIGAAAGAAGIAVAVTGGGDGGDQPGGTPPSGTPQGQTPEPTPTPTPPPDVTGRWVGTFNENPNAMQCTVETDLSLDLQQSGNAVSGTFQLVIRTATSAPGDPCPVGPGDVVTGPVRGSVNGETVMLELQIPGGGPPLVLPGTISDDRMGGTDPAGGGSWEVRRQ
ncbi:MAG: hypothetical protein PVJ73_10395, partial [Acidobacteriota bacterium]